VSRFALVSQQVARNVLEAAVAAVVQVLALLQVLPLLQVQQPQRRQVLALHSARS
jgi:hypothetical protein